MTPADMDSYFGEDSTDYTKLIPELQEYYEETSSLGSPILRHPLVYQVPAFYSWKLANDTFNLKTAKIKELIAMDDPDRALWLYEKPYRLSILYTWWKQAGLVSLDQLREILPEAWTNAEYPFQCGYGNILRMFRATGFVTDAPDHHPPESEVYIFRGCLAKHKRGLSWTFNPRKADWFANRFNKKGLGHVYKAHIPKEGVLGIFLGRNEDEVVVEPKLLYDLEEFST
jgi:hypothetical protein